MTRLAVVEALLASVLGVVVGIGLFFLSRPLVAMVPLDEATWFPDAIQPPLLPAILLLLAIPAVGAIAAVVALRRVAISPLGVQRRQTPADARHGPRGTARRVGRRAHRRDGGPSRQRRAELRVDRPGRRRVRGRHPRASSSIGPWLTFLVGRALHRLPGGASTLLASRRLTDDPRGSFGAIAGVIMAVFVASAFFTFVGYAKGQTFDRAGVLHAGQVFVEMPYNEGPPFAEVPARIEAIPGVTSVLPIVTAELLETGPATVWIAPCVDVARQFEFSAAALWLVADPRGRVVPVTLEPGESPGRPGSRPPSPTDG